MTLPKDAEVLGIAPGSLALSATGAHATIPLEPGPHRRLLAHVEAASGVAGCRISLCLENIRGTQEGAVLQVALGEASARRTPGVEPIGLYGLRRASVRKDQGKDVGLTNIVDLTAAVAPLPLVRSLSADALAITVYPASPLPEPVDIVIGRLVLFWEKF